MDGYDELSTRPTSCFADHGVAADVGLDVSSTVQVTFGTFGRNATVHLALEVLHDLAAAARSRVPESSRCVRRSTSTAAAGAGRDWRATRRSSRRWVPSRRRWAGPERRDPQLVQHVLMIFGSSPLFRARLGGHRRGCRRRAGLLGEEWAQDRPGRRSTSAEWTSYVVSMMQQVVPCHPICRRFVRGRSADLVGYNFALHAVRGGHTSWPV